MAYSKGRPAVDKFRFDKTIPSILAQVCFWAFLQKFVYGYTLQTHDTWTLFGSLTIDYFIVFPCLLLACSLVFAAALKWGRLSVQGVMSVVAAGIAAMFACPFILFRWCDLFEGAARTAALGTASIVLCLSFCILLFAWLGRMQRQALETGVRSVLMGSLVSFLCWCIVMPSYINNTPYVLVLEVAALPVAAILFVIDCRMENRTNAVETTAALAHHRKGAWLICVAGALCAVMLGTSYVDFLTIDLPKEHLEQPTFYALLLLCIAALIVVLFRDDTDAALGSRLVTGGTAALGLLFAVVFMIVFYFAGASGRFCFDLTCALRRFVIIVNYVLILGIALSCGIRADLAMAVGFLTPFLAVRVIMRSLNLRIAAGALQADSDLRLGCMLTLGCMGIAVIALWRIGAGPINHVEADLPLPTTGGAEHASAVERLADSYGLSDRERQVLHYLSLGYSVNRMGELLGITENTVGTHIRSVYKKTGLHTKQEVIDRVAEISRQA